MAFVPFMHHVLSLPFFLPAFLPSFFISGVTLNLTHLYVVCARFLCEESVTAEEVAGT